MDTRITIVSYLLGLTASYLSTFLIPVTPYLVFAVVLVFCDLITGVAAAKKRQENLRSRKMIRTVEKISLYFVAIMLSHGFDIIFLEPKSYNFQVVYMVAGIISITELKSNFENIGEVTGVDFWNHLARLMPKFYNLPKKKTPNDES